MKNIGVNLGWYTRQGGWLVCDTCNGLHRENEDVKHGTACKFDHGDCHGLFKQIK